MSPPHLPPPLPWLCRPLGGVEAVAVLRGGGQPLTLGSLARACLINDTCHSVKRRVGPWCMTVLRSWGNRLFGMERLSLSLSFTLSGPAIRVQDEMLKCCICVFGSQRTGRLFFFLFLSIAPSRFFSLILSFFLKRKRKQANEGKKGKKKLCMRKKQTSPKKTWLRVVREGEVINQSQVWQQRDYYFK